MKTLQSIGILMPGDMGHACGQALKQSGFRVVTFLGGRSDRTQSLSATSLACAFNMITCHVRHVPYDLTSYYNAP